MIPCAIPIMPLCCVMLKTVLLMPSTMEVPRRNTPLRRVAWWNGEGIMESGEDVGIVSIDIFVSFPFCFEDNISMVHDTLSLNACMPRSPRKPTNLQAFEHLKICYTTLRSQIHTRNPWRQDDVLTLGRLFILVWEHPPSTWELKAGYFLPYPMTIRRLFGSVKAFHATLNMTALSCGCTTESRCDIASTLHSRWQHGERPQGLLQEYRAHLSKVAVIPGKAVWNIKI